MNKEQFLKQLRCRLEGRLTAEELADVLSYYEAYFDDSEEDEAAVAERLGSPDTVAEQVLKEQASSAAPGKKRPGRAWIAVLGVCAAVLLLLGTGVWLVLLFLQPAAPSEADHIPVIVGQESPMPDRTPSPVSTGEALAPFTTLDVDVGVGEIRVMEGKDWNLSLTSSGQDRNGSPYELKYTHDGERLKIWSIPENLSGDGSPEGEVLLTVPEGTVLSQVKLSIGVGSLDWDGCAVSGELQAKSGVGTLEVTAPVEKADLVVGVGDVMLKAAAPAEGADLSTGVGDVTMMVAGEQVDYAWKLKTGTGDIRLNGEQMPPFRSSGGDGDRALSLTSGTGDISLEFT